MSDPEMFDDEVLALRSMYGDENVVVLPPDAAFFRNDAHSVEDARALLVAPRSEVCICVFVRVCVCVCMYVFLVAYGWVIVCAWVYTLLRAAGFDLAVVRAPASTALTRSLFCLFVIECFADHRTAIALAVATLPHGPRCAGLAADHVTETRRLCEGCDAHRHCWRRYRCW